MQERQNLTRDEMQTEAMIIESLLGSVMALKSGPHTEDSFALIEMAAKRAKHLNRALDSVNTSEEVA